MATQGHHAGGGDMNAQPFTGTRCTTQAASSDSFVSWNSTAVNMSLREPDFRESFLGRKGIPAHHATFTVQNQTQSRSLETNMLGQDSRHTSHCRKGSSLLSVALDCSAELGKMRFWCWHYLHTTQTTSDRLFSFYELHTLYLKNGMEMGWGDCSVGKNPWSESMRAEFQGTHIKARHVCTCSQRQGLEEWKIEGCLASQPR